MNTSGEQIIDYVAKQIGINKMDLIKASLSQYIEYQIKYLNSELFELKGKYNVETPEQFEKLYENGEIEEENTWKDYQKFDNLVYKIHKLEKLNLNMNKIEELIPENI